jgi:hypothetical protein
MAYYKDLYHILNAHIINISHGIISRHSFYIYHSSSPVTISHHFFLWIFINNTDYICIISRHSFNISHSSSPVTISHHSFLWIFINNTDYICIYIRFIIYLLGTVESRGWWWKVGYGSSRRGVRTCLRCALLPVQRSPDPRSPGIRSPLSVVANNKWD